MKESHQRACFPIQVRVGVIGVLLLFTAGTAGAAFEHHVPSYNELVQMATSRCDVAGTGWGTLRTLPAGSAIGGTQLYNLVSVTQSLTSRFIKWPSESLGPYDINTAGELAGFASLLESDGCAILLVPGDCTSNGVTLTSQNFLGNYNNLPILKEQFMSIYETLAKMRYTVRGGGKAPLSLNTHWSSEGESNTYIGDGGGNLYGWNTAKSEAEDEYLVATAQQSESAPRRFTSSLWDTSPLPGGYRALMYSSAAYFVVEGMSAQPKTITFYNWSRPPPLSYGVVRLAEYDNAGNQPIENLHWASWGAASEVSGTRAVSERLGDSGPGPALPWCSQPPQDPGQASSSLGFEATYAAAVIEWTDLYEGDISLSAVTDSDADGLVNLEDCDCVAQCAPVPRPHEGDSAPRVSVPLGSSNPHLAGGLTVEAYLTEYYIDGVPLQMLSVDTALSVYADPAGQYEFVLITRPAGSQVLFTLKGQKAGEPVGTRQEYRIRKVNGKYELYFPGAQNVVHVFNGVGPISEVRATRDGQERNLLFDRNNSLTYVGGLAITRPSKQITRIAGVYSPRFPIVIPVYQGALVDSVTYRDAANKVVGNITVGAGRIFTATGANGEQLERLWVQADKNMAELTRQGNAAIPMLKRKVERSRDFLNQITVRSSTDISNPDSLAEHKSRTDEIRKSFDWGDDLVERQVGPDGADPLTSRFEYYDDPSDTNNYGRLYLALGSNGDWVRYQYDREGREIIIVRGFLDAPPSAPVQECRATILHYAGDAQLADHNFPVNDDVERFNDRRPRMIIEMLLGQEISRTYHVYAADRHTVKQARLPGVAYDDPRNLTRIERSVSSGEHLGRPASVEHEDGTFTVAQYSYNATAKELTRVEETGAGSLSNITNGTRRISVENETGLDITQESYDIASGLTLSQRQITRDVFGRTLISSNMLAGTASFFTHGCCGVEHVRDPEGLESVQTHTALKQLESTSRAGVTTTLEYDSRGNVIETRASAPGQADIVAASTFDEAGRLVATRNALGFETHYSVTNVPSSGRRESVVLPDGATQITEYYRDGQIKRLSGTATTPVFYDHGVNLDGSTWTRTYSGTDTQATEWVESNFDVLGNATHIVYPDGHQTVVEFDAIGRAVRRTEDGVSAQLFGYDERSRPVLSALDLDDNGNIDLAGIDRVSGSHQRVKIANGKTVLTSEAFVYPAIGTASPRTVSTSLAAADGNDIWSISFGRTNHFHVVRDPVAKRRTETTTRPDGTQLIQVYTNGLLHSTEARDADGVTLTQRHRTYDAFNRLSILDEASPDGSRRLIRYSYDAAGQITNTTVSAGQLSQSTRISFDNMGRPLQVVYPDGGVVQRVYNARGQIVEQSGARTYPVRYSYDALGRMQSLSTYRTGFGGAPDVTRWHYDPARGFMTAKEFADGSTNRFVYRPDGSVLKRHWARGVVTTYQYDGAGSVTNVSYSDGTAPIGTSYDRLGRPVTVRDGLGQHERAYNVDGSIGQESAPQRPGVALQRHYDAFGRYTGYMLQSNLISLATIDYGYDRAGRLASVASPGLSVAYSYGADAVSLTNTAYLGSGYHVARTYDALGRVASIQNRNAAGLVEQSAYTLNAANLRTRQTLADGRYWDYDYDDLGQLVSGKAKQPDGAPMGGRQFEYEYDRIGNRIETQNQRGLHTQESVYSANALNQYEQRTVPGEVFVSGTVSNALRVTVSDPDNASSMLANRTGKHFWAALPVNNAQAIAVLTNITIVALSERIELGVTNFLTRTETRNAILPQTPETYTYDADGNTLSDGLWHYAWNAENRLTNMTSVSGLPPEHRLMLDFAYDYMGRRVCKTVINPTQGTTNQTTYLYDNWKIIAETTTKNEEPETKNDLYYVWGQDLSGTLSGAGGVGGLLAVSQATNLYYCAYDGNGNITAYLTTDGAPVATREYTPFGQTLSQTGPQFTHWFSTKPQDPETTHYAYTFRYYNPETGRWLSRDPIGIRGGVNAYGMVGNDCLNRLDALG
ncbi:MAG: hypothetical protein O3A51_02330, partial [Verrucomicrobia bacterium]|nr:hypothetical protein [Verrucomicrobiota bacterium]